MKTEEPFPPDSQWKALFQEVHAHEPNVDLVDAILDQVAAAPAQPELPKARVQQQLRLAWGSFAASMIGILSLVLSSSIWWPIMSEGFSPYLTESVSISLAATVVLAIGIALFWQLEPLMAYYADRKRPRYHFR